MPHFMRKAVIFPAALLALLREGAFSRRTDGTYWRGKKGESHRAALKVAQSGSESHQTRQAAWRTRVDLRSGTEQWYILNSQPVPPAPPLPTVERSECTICTRRLANSAFPILSSKCAHTNTTCGRCWKDWLKTQIESVPANRVACAECSRILEQADVRALARPAAYEAYLDLEFKAALSVDVEFHWCITPNCDSGQLSSGNIFTCVKCKVKSCTHCAAAWHEGETCDIYQGRIKRRPEDEKKSELEVTKISKVCPGCKSKVTKISGCDHMTCSQCREEFCWLCLADYRGIRRFGNSHHKPACAHHS